MNCTGTIPFLCRLGFRGTDARQFDAQLLMQQMAQRGGMNAQGQPMLTPEMWNPMMQQRGSSNGQGGAQGGGNGGALNGSVPFFLPQYQMPPGQVTLPRRIRLNNMSYLT